MASEKIQGILDAIGALSIGEFLEFCEALQDAWGVTPSVARTRIPRAEMFALIIEDFEDHVVVIKDTGAQKIQVMKALREIIPNLGLKQAKDLVDSAPATLPEEFFREHAVEVKKKLEAVGATVEVIRIK